MTRRYRARAPSRSPLRGYRLGERLGTGRDGTVYAGRLPGVERDLAIRVIREEIADRPAFVRSFEASAHQVASLSVSVCRSTATARVPKSMVASSLLRSAAHRCARYKNRPPAIRRRHLRRRQRKQRRGRPSRHRSRGEFSSRHRRSGRLTTGRAMSRRDALRVFRARSNHSRDDATGRAIWLTGSPPTRLSPVLRFDVREPPGRARAPGAPRSRRPDDDRHPGEQVAAIRPDRVDGDATASTTSGDLDVHLRVQPHERNGRDGDDVVATIPISIARSARQVAS